MIACFYKKSFLKDLAKLPKEYREHVERLVFEQIPELDNLFTTLDIYPIKSRADIYKLFPA